MSQLSIEKIFEKGVCVKKCPNENSKKLDGKTTSYVKDLDSTAITDKFYNSTDFFDYCIPSSYDALPEDMKSGYKLLINSFKTSSIGKYFNDMYLSSDAMFISIVMGLVYCIGYIYLMSAFAECIAWVCIVLTQIGLIGGTISLWMLR